MPNLKPQQLEQLNIRVNEHIATLFNTAKPASETANLITRKTSAVANDILEIGKKCTDVAVTAVQRYTFVGEDAPKVTKPVEITPVTQPAQTQPSSSGGGHK